MPSLDSLPTEFILPLLTAARAVAEASTTCYAVEQQALAGHNRASLLSTISDCQATLKLALADLGSAQEAVARRFIEASSANAPSTVIRPGDWVTFDYLTIPSAIEGEDYLCVSTETALGRFLLGRQIGSQGLFDEPELKRSRAIRVTRIQPRPEAG